jgi:hypothetical protein
MLVDEYDYGVKQQNIYRLCMLTVGRYCQSEPSIIGYVSIIRTSLIPVSLSMSTLLPMLELTSILHFISTLYHWIMKYPYYHSLRRSPHPPL